MHEVVQIYDIFHMDIYLSQSSQQSDGCGIYLPILFEWASICSCWVNCFDSKILEGNAEKTSNILGLIGTGLSDLTLQWS
jgi:hypothetical protein